jgi:hypothetical protein
MQKSLSFCSLCSFTYFGSCQIKQNQTYYHKEKSLKILIISFSFVFFCAWYILVVPKAKRMSRRKRKEARIQRHVPKVLGEIS